MCKLNLLPFNDQLIPANIDVAKKIWKYLQCIKRKAISKMKNRCKKVLFNEKKLVLLKACLNLIAAVILITLIKSFRFLYLNPYCKIYTCLSM